MAETTNLGLTLINGSDFISPTPINNNMTAIDKLGVDYVIEQYCGNTESWWYRKWNSGRAECGIDRKSFGNTTMQSSSWGESFYITSIQFRFGTYPITFVKRPYTSIQFINDQNLGRDRLCIVVPGADDSVSEAPKFYIADASKTDMNPTCGIYVNGWWK